MIRTLLAAAPFVSLILFPWPLTALLAAGVAISEPLVPLAAGLLLDALYHAPHTSGLPLFTFAGALAAIAGVFVRSRLKTGIIGE